MTAEQKKALCDGKSELKANRAKEVNKEKKALEKELRDLNSFYFRILRRVVGVKAAYILRVSNSIVWELAGHPTTPAQIILQQQTKLLLTCLATPPNDPFHHIVFCSALRDRSECNKKSSRGRPPPQWLSLMLGYLQLPIHHFLHTTPRSQTQ